MDSGYCVRPNQGSRTHSEFLDMELNARIGHTDYGRAEKPSRRRWQSNQESTAIPGVEGL